MQPKCNNCSCAFRLYQVRVQCCHMALAEHHGCERGTQVDTYHEQVPTAVNFTSFLITLHWILITFGKSFQYSFLPN